MMRSRYGLFRPVWKPLIDRPSPARAKAMVKRFNLSHNIGAPVRVLAATGRGRLTTTRRRAAVHEGLPVVWVNDSSGYVDLRDVRGAS